MKRWIALGLVMGFFGAASASADIIETKKDGMLNGKILSENGEEVQFKNAKGQTLVFKKKDILFEDRESAAGGKSDNVQKGKQLARKAWGWLKNVPSAVRNWSDQLTEKLIGKVSAPLDRSAANAKSDALNKTMDEAGRAAGAMTKKVTAVNAEIYRQKNEGFGNPKSSTEKKGHFASLND